MLHTPNVLLRLHAVAQPNNVSKPTLTEISSSSVPALEIVFLSLNSTHSMTVFPAHAIPWKCLSPGAAVSW